jgi:hypothetical protein
MLHNGEGPGLAKNHTKAFRNPPFLHKIEKTKKGWICGCTETYHIHESHRLDMDTHQCRIPLSMGTAIRIE